MRVPKNHFNTPIAREGIPFVSVSLLFLFACLAFFHGWGILAGILPAFVLNFFRNPQRAVPTGDEIIVSPADGKIVKAERDTLTGHWKIGIFMNVFDVHLNRIPVSGTVKKITYTPGKFLNADMDKASEQNERNTLVLATRSGEEVSMTQVAGLIARRIVCYAQPGDELPAGTIFGLIRFGSRVDLDLPGNTVLSVGMGERVKGGETILGKLSEQRN
ncbi:MAG: phosphatidylserine decarboxylase family protein [Leptospirales bacterium]